MTLPATISATLSWPAYRGEVGPFEIGGNLYAVLHVLSSSTVQVWKSTDGGNTWGEQDAAHHPTYSSTSFFATTSGTTIYIAYIATGMVIRVIPFDTSTDLWGTATSDGPVANLMFTGSHRPVPMARRSDGSYVVLYHGSTESVMGSSYTRVKYARYSGGSWTSNVDVAGTGGQVNYDVRTVVLGSSDRVHLIWSDATNSDLKHRSLTSGNTLNGIQDIDTSVTIGAHSVGLPLAYVDGANTKMVIPYVDSTSELRAARTTSADSPTWSITEAISATSTSNPEHANANCGAVAADGTTIYAFWPDDTTQDMYYDQDAGSGSWGTDTEWKDAITCNGISIGKVTGGIGVLYDDGGTVKYDIFPISSAATSMPVLSQVRLDSSILAR